MIYLIDDMDIVRKSLVELFQAYGFRVISFSSAEAALIELNVSRPRVVISDLNLGMGRMNGVQFLQEAATRCPEIITVLISTSRFAADLAEDYNLPFFFKDDEGILAFLKEKLGQP